MSDRFDDLSRRVAQPLPRRGALKAIGGAVVGGAALTVLRPFRAYAPCNTPCGANCCDVTQVCLDATTGRCGCGAGTRTCSQFMCCANGGACTFISSQSEYCCCPAGTTPCGEGCCTGGTACLDRTRSICGCAAGQTTCRYGTTLTCCDAGTACPPTATCPSAPVGAKATCVFIKKSDVNLKEHIVPVLWEGP